MSIRCWLILLIILSSALLGSCRGSTGLDIDYTPLPETQSSGWSMRGGDATQRGCFEWEGPENAGSAWRTSLRSDLHPLFELDSGLLLARSNNALVALDQSGNEAWRYATGCFYKYDVTECRDGLLRLLDGENRIHTLTQNGELDSVIVSGINIRRIAYDAQGRSYVSYIRVDLGESQIIALDHNGAERWSTAVPYVEHNHQAMAVGGERLYITDGNRKLNAYSLEGDLLWQSIGEYDSIRSAFLSPDGHCYLQVIDKSMEDDRRILCFDRDGTELFNIALDSYINTSDFDEEHLGPDNGLYLLYDDSLIRFSPDGTQQVVANGVHNFLCIDDDYRIHLIMEDVLSYATFDQEGTYTMYPDVDLTSRNEMTFGDHGNIYISADNDNFSAYHLGNTLEHLWDYTATSRPTNMTVNTQGRITYADKYRLSHYSPDGNLVSEHLLPAELVDRHGSFYRGSLPQSNLHLFTRDQVVFAVNDNAALQWQYDFGSYSVVNCLPDTNRIIVTNGPNLSVLSPQGDLVASYLNPQSEVFKLAAAVPDGTIYAVDNDYPAGVFALTSSCEPLWQAEMEDYNAQSLVITAEDLVLVQFQQKLSAVNGAGEITWDYPVSTIFTGAPAVSREGLIFIPRTTVSSEIIYVEGDPWDPPTPSAIQVRQASNDTEEQQMNEVLIISLDGRLVHAVPEMKGRCLTPLVDSRGIAYIVTDERNMFAVLPSGRISWQEDKPVVPIMLSKSICWAPLPHGGFAFATEYSLTSLGR